MNVFARNTVAAMALIFAVSANATSKGQLLMMCESSTLAETASTELMAEIGLTSGLQNGVSELNEIVAAGLKKATPAQLAVVRKQVDGLGIVMKAMKAGVAKAAARVEKTHGKNAAVSLMVQTANVVSDLMVLLADSAKVTLKYAAQKKDVPASELSAFTARTESLKGSFASLQMTDISAGLSEAEQAKTQEILQGFQQETTVETCKALVQSVRK